MKYVVIQAISFLIVLWVLYKFGIKPVTALMGTIRTGDEVTITGRAGADGDPATDATEGSARALGFDDLGMEAIYEFDVVDMPVTVAVDSEGTSVHETGPKLWKARIEQNALA